MVVYRFTEFLVESMNYLFEFAHFTFHVQKMRSYIFSSTSRQTAIMTKDFAF